MFHNDQPALGYDTFMLIISYGVEGSLWIGDPLLLVSTLKGKDNCIVWFAFPVYLCCLGCHH